MSIFESLENLNVSEACFEDIMKLVEEEISDKDIKGARRRKLGRLETIGKSLDKQANRAAKEFNQAKQDTYKATTPQEVLKTHKEREEARRKMDKAIDKSSENKKAQLKIYGVKDV